MRIAIITNNIDNNSAGTGNYTYHLVKNILSLDKQNSYLLIHSRKHGDRDNIHIGVEECRVPFFTSTPRKIISGAIFIRRILRKKKIEVIHDPGQIGPFFAKSTYKVVLTILDMTPFIMPETHTIYSRVYHKLLLPIVAKKVDKIITISYNTKKDIMRLLKVPKEKIIVTYLGVDSSFKQYPRSALPPIKDRYHLPDNFILFVGTLEPRKNISRLLQAFAIVKKKDKKIKLVLAGRFGWGRENYRYIADRLRISSDVYFIPNISNADLPLVYNLAQLLIYPSLYEGFGLPVLEAMACGCPVVTSNTSSLPEVVGDAGILINPYSSLDIARAIETGLTNIVLRRDLIVKGLKRAKKFSWKKCARETIKAYYKVAKK